MAHTCNVSTGLRTSLRMGDRLGMHAQEGLWMSRLFRGYNAVTLLVVANMAFSGLLVSWVMKFADSIMKASLCMPCLSCCQV